MTKYAQIAINVINKIKNDNKLNPAIEWEKECNLMFGKGTSSASKSCPQETFLGLCDEGLIYGIPQGKYTSEISELNKRYALKGYEYIKNNTDKQLTQKAIWKAIGNEELAHNGQMSILIELYKRGMLKI